MIRYEAKLIMSVDQRVRRLGHGDQRQGVVVALDVILDHACQKLQLLDEMGILGRGNLGNLQFQRGEFFVDSFKDFRCDLFRAVMEVGFPYLARCDDRTIPSGPNAGKGRILIHNTHLFLEPGPRTKKQGKENPMAKKIVNYSTEFCKKYLKMYE